MASVTKRGKTWRYSVSNYVDGKSKPIQKGGFKTKEEALEAAKIVEAELTLNLRTPKQNKVTFASYFSDWIKLYKSNLTKVTRTHYARSLSHVSEYFGDKLIEDITKQDYQKFINWYGSTRAKETVEKIHSHISACVKDAVDEGIIQTDFTRNVKRTYAVRAKRKDSKYLNYKQSQLLLKVLYKSLDESLTHYALLLALTTGMRYGELVGLTWDDFDFENLTIDINKTWGYSKRQEFGFNNTKNESSVRTIRVDKRTMYHFKKLRLKTRSNRYGLVFYSDKSEYKCISNTTLNKELKKITNYYRLPQISIHGLRHTHASILLYQKVSIYYVSERLGHETIDTTLKHYAHLINEYRQRDEARTTRLFKDLLETKKA